jgi:hypothetical protein
MRGAFILYVFPAVPLLALLASSGLVRAAQWVNASRKEALGSIHRLGRVGALCAGILVITLSGWALATSRYEIRDREIYPIVPYLRYVAMAKVQRLKVIDAIARDSDLQLSAEQTIFGFPPIAAAVAVRTERRVAAEQADLAPRWIRMGLVSEREIINAIEADDVRLVITPKLGFLSDQLFSAYLAKCYAKPRRFARVTGDGRGIPDIYVFRHRDGVICRTH